jgi:hypothetical protein
MTEALCCPAMKKRLIPFGAEGDPRLERRNKHVSHETTQTVENRAA